MRAYAVFAGGGVKGAALAGSLKAAQESAIDFLGYAGASAGSIVAFLAAIGYTGDDLEAIMVDRLPVAELAAEIAGPLKEAEDVWKHLSDPGLFLGVHLARHKRTLARLSSDLGLIAGTKLTDSLYDLAIAKFCDLNRNFSFQDLLNRHCKALKIIVSDLGTRKPLIFSADQEHGYSVLDAIQASMSYPFVFKPIGTGDRRLVDGGLCSNLPIFLFDSERRKDHLPVLAFDLLSQVSHARTSYKFENFLIDLLETALGSGDYLMRQASFNVHHIQIPIPSDIGTLDFDLPKKRLRDLYHLGASITHSYIHTRLATWAQASSSITGLQARYGRPEDVEFVLERFASQLASAIGLTNVRANIMMPYGQGRRIVVYQHNMDDDSDQDLDLAEDGGCSGRCWTTKLPIYADLVDAAVGDHFVDWKMTKAEQSKVKLGRKTMFSVPIFALGSGTDLIGILSADSDKHLRRGLENASIQEALNLAKKWAVVLTSILGYS